MDSKQEEIESLLAPFWRTDDGKSATQRAADYGIDLSLIDENLRLTPDQRIDRNQAAWNFIREIQQVKS